MLAEKYRPKSLDEIIGQKEIVDAIKRMDKNNLPHMLFLGPPGCGKTSTAVALAREIWNDGYKAYFHEFNASDERGIYVVRSKIKKLAYTKGKRIIFLDEADETTPEAQNALRRIMETTESTFILTGNKEYRIIDPIKSRCAIFRFKPLSDLDVGRKLLDILKAENIKFDRDNEEFRNGFKLLVKEVKGDLRLAVNMLEQLITENKEINVKNILALRKPVLAADALKLALQGDINKAREMMEDALVLQNNSADVILEDLTKAIGEVEDQEIRARLYIRLAEVERNLKLGTNPVLQFIAFLSYAWVLPHLPRGG